MYPHERSLVKKFADKPFTMIGVNSDEDREEVKRVVRRKNLPWRSFWNGGGRDGAIATAWNVGTWPTSYLLDGHGVIRFKNLRGDALDKAIAELLSEPG